MKTEITARDIALLDLLRKASDDEDWFTLINFDNVIENIEHPQFDTAGRIHDWRNHVPQPICAIWDQLSGETRIVAYLMAAEAAHDENWG